MDIQDLLTKLKRRFGRKDDFDPDLDMDLSNSYYAQDFTSSKSGDQETKKNEEPLEDGYVYIPDEEDEASKAKRLKRGHIIAGAGALIFIGVAAMAYNAVVGPNQTDQDGQRNSSGDVTVNNSNRDLPSSYSDIAKYQQEESESQPVKSQTNSKVNVEPAVVRESRPARERQSEPSAAPSAPQGLSPAEQAAIKAAEQAQKEEAAAMQSSIAFKLASAITSAVTGNTPQNSGSNTPTPPGNSQRPQPLAGNNSLFNGNQKSGGMYALQAGSVIPATLQTGVSSDMPNGDVVALVRQNIYDSLTGTHLLIPQGSKIIGTYGSAGARGNKRIGVVFKRIIFPDGSNVTLPEQKAIDGTGTPGLADKYTNHSSSLFRTAFMSALLASAASAATGNTSGWDNRSPGQEAVAGAVAEVMEAASDIIERDANIAPTITISPGYQFNIFINQDLMLGEYYE